MKRDSTLPTYAVAAFLLRSRETQAAINRRLREEMKELESQLDWQAQQRQQQQQEINVLRLVFDWLGLEQSTPTRTAIRNWLI